VVAISRVDTQRFPALLVVEDELEDSPGHKHGSEQVRQQAERKRDCETFDRHGAALMQATSPQHIESLPQLVT
jgi:hypothetical protein